MKRILALILMSVMLLSSTAIAADLELWKSPEYTEGVHSKSNAESSKEMILNYDTSFEITINSDGFEVGKSFNEPLDMSTYKYFNAWIYSPEKFTKTSPIKIDIYNKVNSENTRLARGTINVNWLGWKLVSVSLSSFEIDKDTPIDWEKVTKWRYTTYGQYGNWDEDTYLYMDKIWLSTENPYDIEEGEAITVKSNSYMPTDTTHTRLSSASRKIQTTTNEKYSNIGFEPIDITSYNYINAWVYSDDDATYNNNGTEKTPNIRYRLYDGKNNATATKADNYMSYAGISWKGWKLISIPFADLTFNEGFDKTKVTNFYVITNPGGWNAFDKDTALYYDKVWFSSEKPTNSLTSYKVISENDGEIFYSFDNMLKVEFPDDVTLKNQSDATVGGKDATLYQLSPNTIGVIMNEKLGENSKDYILSIPADTVYDKNGFGNSAIEEKITTAAEGVTAAEPEEYGYWYKWENVQAVKSKLSTTVKVYNTTNENKEVVLYLAIYNSSNELIQLAASEHTVAPGVKFIETPELDGYRDGYTVKSFIWEADTLKPLAK